MHFWGLLGLFFWGIGQGLAQEQTVRVLETTKTHKTLQINLGHLDGVAFDDLAVFLVRPDKNSSRTYYVGKAESVKIFPNTSLWYMRELKDPLAVERGAELIIMRKADSTRGIVPNKYHRKKIVLRERQKNKVRDALDSYQGKFPEKLIQKKNEYVAGNPLVPSEVSGDEDELDLLDLYSIKKEGDPITNDDLENLESLYIKELQEGPQEKVVEEKLSDEDFMKRTEQHLDRLSDEKNDPSYLVEKTKRDPDYPKLSNQGIRSSLYESVMEGKVKTYERQEQVKRWMKEMGPRWSEDLSDEELSNFIEEHGLRTEKARQEEASLHLTYHEFHAGLGFHIIDKSSHTDDNIYQRTYTLQAGLEYHLSKRYPKLERFTVDATGRITYDNLDLTEKNGKYSDQSVRLSGFFYPWHLPSALNNNLIFAGSGIRLGRGQIEATKKNIVAPYLVRALPTAHVGWKYRLSSGLGYRVMMSWEWMQLTLQDSAANTTHPDEITFLDQKIELGLIYSF